MKKLLAYPKTEKIYLIPTTYGFLFSFGILLILLVAITYGNNLAFLLSFLLGSTVLVSMIFTHLNLEGVQLLPRSLANVQEGENGILFFSLKSTSLQKRYDLKAAPGIKSESLFLRPGGEGEGELHFPVGRRGKYSLDLVKLGTHFPLGLFYAWKYTRVGMDYYVYPRPVNYQVAPSRQSGEGGLSRGRAEEGEDFSSHRPYFTGDPQKHVDWKAYARTRELLVKEFRDGERSRFPFDFSWNHPTLQGLKAEERISQIAFWIGEARRTEAPFSLELPHGVTALSSGPLHVETSLQLCATLPHAEEVPHG